MEPVSSTLRTNPAAPVASPARSTRIALATIGASGFALLTTAVGAASGAPLEFLVLDLAIGLTYIVSGVIAWLRRPEVLTGPLLVLCGVFNFIGSYGPSGRPVVSISASPSGYYDVALAVLVLALPAGWPTGRAGSCRSGSSARSWSEAVAAAAPGPVDVRMPGLPAEPVRHRQRPRRVRRRSRPLRTSRSPSSHGGRAWSAAAADRSRPLARHVLWPILVAGVIAMLVGRLRRRRDAVLHLDRRVAAGPRRNRGTEVGRGRCTRCACSCRSASSSARCGCACRWAARGAGRRPRARPSPVRLQSALGAALGDPASGSSARSGWRGWTDRGRPPHHRTDRGRGRTP